MLAFKHKARNTCGNTCGWQESKAGKFLALHLDDPDSFPGTLTNPVIMLGVVPENRVHSND